MANKEENFQRIKKRRKKRLKTQIYINTEQPAKRQKKNEKNKKKLRKQKK